MDIFEYIDRVKANFDKQPEPRYNMKKYFMGGSVTTPKRGLVDEPGSYSKPQKIGGEALKTKNLAQRTEIDSWLNNWLDDNFKNYNVKDREKFLKNLKKDLKKAQKTKFKNNRLAQSGDLPTVTPKTTTVRLKPGDSEKVFKENKVFYKNFGEHLVAGNEIEKDRFYKRLFFAGQIETNPKLKKDIDNYFKTVALNKGRRFGYTDAELKKAYEVMTSNPDVPFLLSPDSGIDTSMKRTLFANRFKSYQPYREKTALNSIKYMQNVKKLEKITGIAIRKEISKEHNALKKILDISTLPEELKYSVDHLYGISEAVRNPKNKKFATEVAKNLIGGTVFQNTNAGFGGYSVKRKSLINNINEGKNVTKSLNRLNELTTEFYPKFKNLKQPYKIVNGELTFAKGFKGETQSERFTSYFKEIDKTKQGRQLIKKEYGSLKNLANALAKAGFRCGAAKGLTCDNPEAYFKDIKIQTERAKKGQPDAIKKFENAGNVARKSKGLLKATGYGILGEAGFEGAFVLNDILSGMPVKEAFQRSLFQYVTPKDFGRTKDAEISETKRIVGDDPRSQQYVKDLASIDKLMSLYDRYEETDSDVVDAYTQEEKFKAEEDLKNFVDNFDPETFERTKFGSPEQQAFAAKEEVEDVNKIKRAMDIDPFMFDRNVRRTSTPLFGDIKAKQIGRIPIEDKLSQIAAYGGVSKLSSGGIASGPPPEKGPQSQGLAYLMKNGKR